MNKIIRWPGLVAFVVIFGGAAIFGILFLDNLLKKGLSYALTEVNHAEVNIERLEIQWSPFAIEIENIEMTDPEKPTHNRFFIGKAAARVQFLDLLIGRVIVDELTASDLKFDTERSRVGKVLEVPEKEEVDLREKLAAFNIELPTSKSFLEGANITTPQLVKDIEAHFKARKERFELAKGSLPESGKLAEYEAQVTQILESNPKKPAELLKAREQLKEIKEQIRQDQKAISEFMSATASLVTDTQSELSQLQTAYQDDMARAQAILKFDENSLTELSGLLFGPQVETWVVQGLAFYEFIAPFLEKNEEEVKKPSRWAGRHIDFDTGKVPSLWIKDAHLSLWMEAFAFQMDLQHLTWEHARIGVPTTFQVFADKSVGWQRFDLSGEFSINPFGEFLGQQNWQLAGVPIEKLELIGSSSLNTFLDKASFNIGGDLQVKNTALQGRSKLSFTDTNFRVEGHSSIAKYLGQALNGIKNFDMDLSLAGQLTRPSIGLSSNLDHQLGAQFSQIINTEVQTRLADIKQDLMGQTQGLTAEIEPWLKQIQDLRAQGENFEDSVQNLLKAELDDLVESKGKDVLKGLFNRKDN